VLSILPNQPVKNQWNWPREMERHCSIETKFPSGLKSSIFFSRELLIVSQQSGTEIETFLEMERQVSVGRASQRGPPA